MDLYDRARLYLAASVAQVDNVFQLTRWLMSALERPFYTPSGGWNGAATQKGWRILFASCSHAMSPA